MIKFLTNLIKNMKQSKIDKVFEVAEQLCVANNTVTTLEIKNELRRAYPKKNWSQSEISQVMSDFYVASKFTYSDTGTFRVYSLANNQATNQSNAAFTAATTTPVVKVKKVKVPTTTARISRNGALDLIKNSNGKFFTVTFIKKDGSRRVMNGQHTSDMSASALGYINVKDITAVRRKEASTIKSVNLQTIESIKLNNVVHKVA
jgi:phage/plasmid primase-like uncharacterized protein